MSKLYKIIGLDGKPIHGGAGRWHLPTDDAPGEWMPDAAGTIIACERGYHLVTHVGLLDWLKCPAVIYEAEGRGACHSDDGAKTAFRSARLLHRVGVLTAPALIRWAADCAERVLPIWETWRPDDPTPRRAVDAARAGATKATEAAARAATYATGAAAARAAGAAWTAAGAARDARVAARNAGAADAAGWTAEAAARAARAAGVAAGAAGAADVAAEAAKAAEAAVYAAAARAAERQWQVNRLFKLLELET
jgi:hypothetical protein